MLFLLYFTTVVGHINLKMECKKVDKILTVKMKMRIVIKKEMDRLQKLIRAAKIDLKRPSLNVGTVDILLEPDKDLEVTQAKNIQVNLKLTRPKLQEDFRERMTDWFSQLQRTYSTP